MFIAALFKIVKIQKPPKCPSIDYGLKKNMANGVPLWLSGLRT